MSAWRWLRPGLHLKRWAFAIVAGLALLVIGVIAFTLDLFQIETDVAVLEFVNLPLSLRKVGLTAIVIGLFFTFAGMLRLLRRVSRLLRNKDELRDLLDIALERNILEQGPRIVCVGGGTGMSTILSGLRNHSGEITAIVSVADDGGSSGRLRHDFDMLPPGDIRNCLVALASGGTMMGELMQYRFDEGELAGHSFGNLFITVLAQLRGDFGQAVREANRILAVRGQVLPATLDKVSLVATHPDGTKTTGQGRIARCGKEISSLELKPAPGETPPDVLAAIADADIIILGPGSLYTSVLPPLLDPEIVEAIRNSHALTIFVINVMGQPGETGDFTVNDHIETFRKHLPGIQLHAAIINNSTPSASKLAPLEEKGIKLTPFNRRLFSPQGTRIILRDVINLDNPKRHDPDKLAIAVMDVWREFRTRPRKRVN